MATFKSPAIENEISRDRLAELLNEDLAREYQAIIGYVVYSQVLKGAEYMDIASQLEIHAKQELDHALIISRQIDYLGQMPAVIPKPVRTSKDPKEMLRFDLENENDTIRNYRDRVGQCEALGEFAMAEQIAFSDFKGYEDWSVVSSARTEEVLKVIVANPKMINAYKTGVPGNSQIFPDGSMIVKLQWKPKKSTEAQFAVDVPDVFSQAFVMEKDSTRFPKSGGWGYAVFNYDAASDKFTADPKSLSDCGNACHTVVKAKDYIFHPYQKR